MTGFRGRYRERDCLQIAHFANHDHVGVFPQRSAKRGSEREGVRVHLALSDVTIFRRNDVFNGILKSDNMVAPREINLFNQRGQRRALSAAHRARHQNEPVVILGKQCELWR